jgi:hypothetical protein
VPRGDPTGRVRFDSRIRLPSADTPHAVPQSERPACYGFPGRPFFHRQRRAGQRTKAATPIAPPAPPVCSLTLVRLPPPDRRQWRRPGRSSQAAELLCVFLAYVLVARPVSRVRLAAGPRARPKRIAACCVRVVTKDRGCRPADVAPRASEPRASDSRCAQVIAEQRHGEPSSW